MVFGDPPIRVPCYNQALKMVVRSESRIQNWEVEPDSALGFVDPQVSVYLLIAAHCQMVFLKAFEYAQCLCSAGFETTNDPHTFPFPPVTCAECQKGFFRCPSMEGSIQI